MVDAFIRRSGQPALQGVAIEDELDNSFAASLQHLWGAKFGGILAKVRTIQQDGLQSIFLDALAPETDIIPRRRNFKFDTSPFDADRAFDRMSSFLKRQSNQRVMRALGSKDDFAKRYKSELRLRNLVHQIDLVEGSIESEMKPIEELSKLVKKLFVTGKSLSFDGPRISVQSNDNQEIGLERLSSGEKHLIRLLVAAIDAGESTLLIDEPELSLHIDWQRDLIKNIRSLNPLCQLVFATHSPEIMADIDNSNIFRI